MSAVKWKVKVAFVLETLNTYLIITIQASDKSSKPSKTIKIFSIML